MFLDSTASEGALFARADRAVADAAAIRAGVRADLAAAGQRRVHRAHADDTRPSEVPPLGPTLRSSFLKPWRSTARTLADAGEMLRTADRGSDLAWHRVLPGIETPLGPFEG